METTTIGSHRCVDTGQKFGISGSSQPVTLWRCVDCGVENSWNAFDASKGVCPARPDQITVTVNMQNNTHLGLLAAREWLALADVMGLKMSVWAQQAVADRVGPEGGKIAELSCWGSWHVVLDNTGHVAAHQGRDWDCTTCDELRQAGKLPAKTAE